MSGAENAGGASAPPPPPPRKQFTHPVLTAMGIPRLRVPSRNWMIFWAVTGTIGGLMYYDRRERKARREFWKERVSFLAKQKIEPLDVPRKVTVYLAPPPGDYLDISLTHFRQYIKPILVAAAVDYDVKTETRQGEIRSSVAEQIRNKRRQALGLPLPEGEDELKEKIESKLNYDNTGGVICVGRGAYREYMTGIQEGWLGPLEQPEPEQEPEPQQPQLDSSVDQTQDKLSLVDAASNVERPAEVLADAAAADKISAPVAAPVEQDQTAAETETSLNDTVHDSAGAAKPDEAKQDDDNKDESEKKEKKKPVPKPYIRAEQYAEAPTPAEFDTLASFEPVAAIGHPHILGFRYTPIRTYRYFTRRYLADEMGAATAAVVLGATRPFDKTDAEALLQEEDEWPKWWKKEAAEKGSEWVQPFIVDERVASRLSVYRPETESEFVDDLAAPSNPTM